METGVILINTGSPKSPLPGDVKKYLAEFLMDERVIDISKWKRRLLVHGIIAPFRSRKVSGRYGEIWTTEGAPLVVTTKELAKQVAIRTGMPVECAMRYGKPSIKEVLQKLTSRRIKRIIAIPMFPHYAMSTYESVVEKLNQEIKSFPKINIEVIKPYYDNPRFIHALYDNAREILKKKYDHIIFSYHSLPLRQLRKTDDSKSHCLVRENCCEGFHPSHQKCYRAQTLRTTRLFIEKAGIDPAKSSLTYQSAMGGTKWLQPGTEEKIVELAKTGVKRLVMICPGFVTDNLETIEEIGIRGRDSFIKNGGTEFHFIPSLNVNDKWITTLAGWIRNAT